MKRGFFLGVLILFLILFPSLISSEVTGEIISGDIITGEILTGESITGEATTQQVNMQIFVQLTLPYLYLRSPINGTYRNNESILINYTVQNEDFVWYNFDNGPNVSITGATYVGIPEGTYRLYIFANNSNGFKTSQVDFTANNSKLVIIYDEFKGVNKGVSSNFDNYTYEELNSVEDVILENTAHGKIEFRESIDFLESLSAGESIVNLDSNIEISSNSIFLNSPYILGLNKSAALSLYNIEFDNPQILKDGVICPVALCQIQSYSGGTLIFNVNSFSTYTSRETPEGGTVIIGGGGGSASSGGSSSGGDSLYLGPPEEPSFFNLSTDSIYVKLKQGGTKEEFFEIWNIGDETLYFAIASERTENFLKISNKTFKLDPGEKVEIILDFLAKENFPPELYLGKLIIETLDQEKEILIVMEVESKKSLFDIRTEIERKYRTIQRGEEIVLSVELFNLGEVKRADVLIEYIIKDKEGNELFKEHEMVAIETRASFLKTFQVPYSLAEGEYVLYTRVIYGDEVASSSSWFTIKNKFVLPWPRVILYFILFFILFVIIRLYQLYVKEQRKENVKKYDEEEKKEERSKIKSLAKSASEKGSELKKGLEPKQRYVGIKTPLSSKKKVVRKKVRGRLTPSGYLDLTEFKK